MLNTKNKDSEIKNKHNVLIINEYNEKKNKVG